MGDKIKSLPSLGLRGASDVLALDEDWRADDLSSAAMHSLREAEATLAQTTQKASAAQSALCAAQTQGSVDSNVLELLKKAVFDAGADIASATTARNQAVSNLLTVPVRPVPASDRSAMLVALASSASAGGPGLTDIGFLTIASRLRANKYAMFIKRLIDS